MNTPIKYLKSITTIYSVAVRLLLLCMFVFFAGFSLKFALRESISLSGDYIILTSIALFILSIPFSAIGLIMCCNQGVITNSNLIISFVASLFFFVFGYIAAVFTLGHSIRAYQRGNGGPMPRGNA